MLFSLIEKLELPLISLPPFLILFVLVTLIVKDGIIELIFVKAEMKVRGRTYIKVRHFDRLTCVIAWLLFCLGYLKNRKTDVTRLAKPFADREYIPGHPITVWETIYELDAKGLDARQHGRLGLRFYLATIGGLVALLITANSLAQALCSFIGLEFVCMLLPDCPC